MNEEECFCLKNGLNMGLLQRVWIEKNVYGVVTHWLFGNEKTLDTAVNKEVHTNWILSMKGTITINFLEIGVNVNSFLMPMILQNSHWITFI